MADDARGCLRRTPKHILSLCILWNCIGFDRTDSNRCQTRWFTIVDSMLPSWARGLSSPMRETLARLPHLVAVPPLGVQNKPKWDVTLLLQNIYIESSNYDLEWTVVWSWFMVKYHLNPYHIWYLYKFCQHERPTGSNTPKRLPRPNLGPVIFYELTISMQV